MQEGDIIESAEQEQAAAEDSGEDAPNFAPDLGPAPALGPQDVEAELHVKDAGMMLVSAVAPDFTWQSGNADIAIRSGLLHACLSEATNQLDLYF